MTSRSSAYNTGAPSSARTRTSGLERLVERAAEEQRLEVLAADEQTAEESVRGRRTEDEG